jgi:hypothetical protein
MYQSPAVSLGLDAAGAAAARATTPAMMAAVLMMGRVVEVSRCWTLLMGVDEDGRVDMDVDGRWMDE